jgi:6-phosphogluconolactonase
MNNPELHDPLLHEFETEPLMFKALADEIAARLSAGVERRGRASLIASGGTTPGALYDELSTRDLPWRNITVGLSDERWVPPSFDTSNEKLVRTRLLKGDAGAASFVAMKTEDANPQAAEEKVSSALAAMPRPIDVTLLGKGNDGHTASMLPGSKGLEDALDTTSPLLVRGIEPANIEAAGERMSLTLRAILGSRLIVVLIKGHEKLATYNVAVTGEDIRAMPVRTVLLQTQTPVQVYWAP